LNIAQLNTQKLADEIIRQVTKRMPASPLLQNNSPPRAVLSPPPINPSPHPTAKRIRHRSVLENIQSEQDLTRARFDYVTIVAEFNKLSILSSEPSAN